MSDWVDSSGSLRPSLDDVLQIEDARVGEAISINGHSTFQILVREAIEELLSVVRLVQRSHEHPVGSNDDGESGVVVLLQIQETVDLLVPVGQGVHIERVQNHNGMLKRVLVNHDQAFFSELLHFRVDLLELEVVFFLPLVELLPEVNLRRDETVKRDSGERNLNLRQDVDSVELARLRRLLASRKNLSPAETLSLTKHVVERIPVQGGKRRLNVQLEALQHRGLVSFEGFLLHESSLLLGLVLHNESLSEREVLINDQLLVIRLQILLEQQQLSFNLREWVHQQHVVVVEHSDSGRAEELKFAVIRHLKLVSRVSTPS